MSLLSNLQKREIAIAARAAYEAKPDREAFEAINSEMSRSACFEAWRHVENGKATGVQRSTQMTQDHYAPALAHFQAMLGVAGQKLGRPDFGPRRADNDRRIARYKLEQSLRERGLELGYAAAICWRTYKRPLAEATEAQLWKINFTVRNRKKK